jgi:hypothetical protein
MLTQTNGATERATQSGVPKHCPVDIYFEVDQDLEGESDERDRYPRNRPQ